VTAAPRVLAPFGRRGARVVDRRVYGAYVVLRCADPDGPRPRAGQFYMLAAEAWGGGDGERPFLPRAFSALRAGAGQGVEFLIEDVGPGTHRLCELEPGQDLLLVGPLGVGFGAPADGRRPLLVGGGVGIAPLAIWQDELGGASALLGFRDAARAEGARLLADAQVATDDGSVGHHGLVTDLLALESGMACGFGACFGCVVPTRHGYIRLCVDGPVLEASELDTALVGGELVH